MLQKTIINRCVKKIIEDIQDRRGIGDEWDDIDASIKKEIRKKWFEIIDENIDELMVVKSIKMGD